MRGQPNTFRDSWTARTIVTTEGRLEFIVFPGPPPFYGCARLDGRPIAVADAARLLVEVGDEHAGMGYVGDSRITVPPRQSM